MIGIGTGTGPMSGPMMTGLLCSCAVLTGLSFNRGAQAVAAGMLGAWLLFAANPAFADQTLMVEDNARVACVASQNDLTRISLIGDEFASVSKSEQANPLDDFGVVNEPTRGDIYISVPEGFRPKAVSFFGTSKRGFVYKFACAIENVEAQQIFLSNLAAVAKDKAGSDDAIDEVAPDGDETAVRLIQAMASQQVVPGYRLQRPALAAVRVGDLSVQQIAEYRGLDLTGRVIRIENISASPVTLTEEQVAPAGATAVSIATSVLAPRQVTSAYIVSSSAGYDQ